MKNKLLVLFSLCIIILAIAGVSADVIMPGERPITINNYITNINDFPDYIFVSAGGIGTGMCPLQRVGSDGKISDQYYKFCGVFVYAIPKDKFDINKINEINENESLSGQEVKSYLDSIGGTEVLKDINIYKQVPDVSPVKEENNQYNISLSQVKKEPDKVDTTRNKLIYVYILVPIIAILIIILILIKRNKK
jgi:hypothetical protein